MNYRSDTQSSSINLNDNNSKEYIGELSLNQYGLWFLDRLIPESTMYNIPWKCHINGHLNIETLSLALQKVWERHDILRSSICVANDKPFIIYSKRFQFPFEYIDLTLYDSEQSQEKVDKKIKEESIRPFNLNNDSLVHIILFQQSEHKFTLFFNMHHIIFDGWSMQILLDEMSNAYNSLLDCKEPKLPILESSFHEFSIWNKQHFQGSSKADQLQYWIRKLEGVEQGSHFPTDYSRFKEQSYAGKILTHKLSKPLMDNLTLFARKERSTLYMVLLTALDILLYKYTDSCDFVVGSPMAGRSKKEFESLIGYFVNLVVLRTTSSPDQTFRELLKEVRKTTLEAHAYQDLPLDILVQEILLKRSSGTQPFIQTVFAYEEDATLDIRMEGLQLSPIEGLPTFTSKFDSTWTITNKKEFFELNVEFSTDLFEEESISLMISQYEWILQSILDHPESSISAFDLIDTLEQEKLTKGETIILDSSLRVVAPGIEGTLYISHIADDIRNPECIANPFITNEILEEIGKAKRKSNGKLKIISRLNSNFSADESNHNLVVFDEEIHQKENHSITGKEIYEVWKNVLNLEEIQPTDNFFELGGHSLLAIQIIVRLRDVVGAEIPLRILFETDNIEEFIQAVDTIILSEITIDHN